MCTRTAAKAPAEETKVPFLAKVWRNAYLSIPRLNFPFTNVDISLMVISAACLIAVRVLSDKLLRKEFGWPEDEAIEASASLAGIFHSTLLCPALLVNLMSQPYRPSEHRKVAPQWSQDFTTALLQFCTGYMVYDAIFIVLTRLRTSPSWVPEFTEDDIMFLAHHFMTATYMTQTRVYEAGHMSAMMCMFLGEASNPAMNGWFVTSKAVTLECCGGPLMEQVHYVVEVCFAVSYFLLRTVIGSFYFVPMSWDLAFSKTAREHLPLLVRIFWIVMIWAVMFGSYTWVVFCYKLIQKDVMGIDQEL